MFLLATTSTTGAWYAHASGWLLVVAAVPALAAALALAGFARNVYRGTLGRRRDRYARLRRLGTNAQLSYFVAVLGDPPAMRRLRSRLDESKGSLFEWTWIDRDFYVHAFADSDETVQAYSVTTRARRFKPPFHPPGAHFVERRWPFRKWERTRYRTERPAKIMLGKTRFVELGTPWDAELSIGNQGWHYVETHLPGHVGHYQFFAYSLNRAGWQPEPRPQIGEPDGRWHLDGDPMPDWLVSFRKRRRMNTYTVILDYRSYPRGEFGVQWEHVRTLDQDS